MAAVAAHLRALIAALRPDLRERVAERLRLDLADGAGAAPPAAVPAPPAPAPGAFPPPAPRRAPPPGPPPPLDAGGAELLADLACELLEDDEDVLERTSAWPRARWRALIRCFHDHVLERLRALAASGGAGPTEAAIREVALDALKALRRDPAAWSALHCPKRPR